MTGWRPTAALGRSLVVGVGGTAIALVAGEPVLVVLAAPFVVLAALAAVHRPRSTPTVRATIDHPWLHEGQATTCRLELRDADGIEHLARVAEPTPYVRTEAGAGRLSGWLADGTPTLEVSARRWGRHRLGAERVGLTSAWAGYRCGPLPVVGELVHVLPEPAPYDARAAVPHPVGLVGRHPSRRSGSGVEIDDIRSFQPGDRLRRINWRVSLRTDRLQVTTSPAEQDASVLLVVDALADHGRSEGVDGLASSLDLAVRAASAVAEHHVRAGDRVALRVLGGGGEQLRPGAGRRHLRRLQTLLAEVRAGEPRDLDADRLRLSVPAGTVVVVLSPALAEAVVTVAATAVRRGLSTLVVDTLPPDARPGVAAGVDPVAADLAWRMRRLERAQVLSCLATLGCPVVPWRGAGSTDEVMRQLGRQARRPRVVAR